MAEQHPIQTLMQTTMENLKEMIDVNKVIGEAVETPHGQVIIPVSRVSFGFVTGGSEFEDYREEAKTASGGKDNFPFGGGSGGGVALRPVAFLVTGPEEIRLLPVDRGAAIDRLIEAAPSLIKYLRGILTDRGDKEFADRRPRI